MVLESKIENDIKYLYFNDEASLNAISSGDWKSLKSEIESFEKSDQKYLVIKHINGNYSAGAQLGENINSLMEDVSNAAETLWNCKKPVISLVNGIAAGAGSNMMLLSDFIIATPETRFIEVFVRRGLVVDFGGSWVLPRIIGIQKAKSLMMTSNEINGTELNNLGVLHKLCSLEDMDKEFESLIESLNRIRQPFNINSFAQKLAINAIDDKEHIQKSIDVNQEGLKYLSDELSKLKLATIPSVGNFISFHGQFNGKELFDALLRKGIIVRQIDLYDMPDFIRVTVGTMEQNQIFISALKELL